MTDIDLMTEEQIAVMTVLAVGLWTWAAWVWYRTTHPKRPTIRFGLESKDTPRH